MFSNRTNWKLSHNRFTLALEQVRASGRQILDLTVSNPTRVGLRYHEAVILNALASPQALDYDPQPKGLLAAREAAARYYAESHRISGLDPERIVLTTSTSEGYSYVFRLLCNTGDELLVPKPSYPLFEFLADLQDVRLVPYPLIYDHGWQIDLHSLQSAISQRTRGIVLVHPNNPTGSYVKPEEAESLNAFCREHGLALIVDEVFLDYSFAGKPSPTFAANETTLTFTLSGLSKISALPQMKVAWIVVSGPPQAISAAMPPLEVIADTYLSMNAPLQWAMPALLDQRKDIQQQLSQRILNNLQELDHQLARQKSWERLMIEGGWYAILRVPVTQSDEDLAIELLQGKLVLVHPGHFYDFPRDGYLVLSLITPEKDFAEALKRIFHS
ncbi:MAG TPA: pyridoxal phosphate-dependent aminotransferase [Candidatus Sulfotelmatobacter sp.]|nr:pyridoxal phosphate-dependent aminotransferase [Candidatus Sulfotelmatobacter sp.]